MVVIALAAIVPPRPSVLPPRAGNEEPKKALNPEQDRADKGEKGYLGGLDRHVHAATVGRHDDGDGAAVRLVEDTHGLRSLRARSLKAQPDHGRGA